MSEPSQEVVDLIKRVELRDVGVFELYAARGGLREDGSRVVVGPGSPDEPLEFDEEHGLGVYWLASGGLFLVRLSMELTGEAGHIRVGVQAEYHAPDLQKGDISKELEMEFVNRVAIMTLVPYIRAEVAHLSGHVFRQTRTMRTIRPGDLDFSPAVQEPEPGPAGDDPSIDSDD